MAAKLIKPSPNIIVTWKVTISLFFLVALYADKQCDVNRVWFIERLHNIAANYSISDRFGFAVIFLSGFVYYLLCVNHVNINMKLSIVYYFIKNILKMIKRYDLAIPANIRFWSNVGLIVDSGPTLNQRWTDVSCMLGCNLSSICHTESAKYFT